MDASTIRAPAGKAEVSGRRPAPAPCFTTKAGPRRGRRSTKSKCVPIRWRGESMRFRLTIVLVIAVASVSAAQQSGVPAFQVDPFWPKPLPNRWSMQQVTGIFVDPSDHIWFLNRAAKADADEV